MNKAPAFQFYPGDFLSDGQQMAMSLSEAGAYIRLMCVCWKEGSIPDEPKALWKMAQADSLKEFEMVWPRVRVCFKEAAHGGLIHPRLEKERKKQQKWRNKSKKGGLRSAELRAKRKGGSTTPQPPSQPKGNTSVFSLQSSTSVTDRESPSEAHTIPNGWAPNEQHKLIAYREGVADVEREGEKFSGHAKAKGRMLSDWDAGFSNWLHKVNEFAVTKKKGTEQTRQEFGGKLDAEMKKQGVTPHHD